MDGPDCPACGYIESVHMGTMGSTEWFRCRACGMDHSLDLAPTPDDQIRASLGTLEGHVVGDFVVADVTWTPIKTVTLQPGEAELLFPSLPECDDPDCEDCC